MMEKTPVILPFKFTSFAPTKPAAEEKKDNIVQLRRKIVYLNQVKLKTDNNGAKEKLDIIT